MALGSVGIGTISLVAFDTIAIHNIHRQICFCLSDEGKYKVDVVKSMINSKSSYTKVNTFNIDFDEFTSNKNNVYNYDLIIDATDSIPIRVKIDRFAKTLDIPWIYGSVEEFYGQVCLFDKVNFEDIFKILDKKTSGVATPIVMHIASLQANLAIRYLLDLKVTKDKLYYCFFNKYGEYVLQKFNI
jgi:adenylyltransferase/sulfurtransferase